MTTGPENPYGEPQTPPSQPPYQPPYQPPVPPPAYPQQPTYGAPGYPQQPGYPPYGAPGYLPPGYGVVQQNEGLAVAAMVIGIVSFVLACGYGIGLLGSPVALVLGRISMKRIDQSGGQLGGRGMAQAGFIMGIIGTILLVLAFIALVVVIVAAANGSLDDY